jgi:hypothetical protein
MFLYLKRNFIEIKYLIIFTCGGFLISIKSSLNGLVILGRRVSELVIIGPFTARNKQNIDRIEKTKMIISEKEQVKIYENIEINSRPNQVLCVL